MCLTTSALGCNPLCVNSLSLEALWAEVRLALGAHWFGPYPVPVGPVLWAEMPDKLRSWKRPVR
jgi:hypothetical protein